DHLLMSSSSYTKNGSLILSCCMWVQRLEKVLMEKSTRASTETRMLLLKIVQKSDLLEEMAKREARFAREVSMLARVQHRNLVK
ncbi:hypothetical protein KI387_028359, partial [Taxus chinensis]